MKLRAVSVLLLIVASPVLRAAETAPADPVREANRALHRRIELIRN